MKDGSSPHFKPRNNVVLMWYVLVSRSACILYPQRPLFVLRAYANAAQLAVFLLLVDAVRGCNILGSRRDAMLFFADGYYAVLIRVY